MNISRKTQIGAATAAVALTAAGAAVAAARLHTSRSGLQTGIAYGSAVSSSTSSPGAWGHADHGPGPGWRGGHDGRGGELTAATAYLGISADALRSSLESGKTLAQIADATTGKSASGLIDALVTAEQTELASAVKAGNLTQAQADQISTGLKAHVTDEVNGTFRGRPRPGPGGRGDHGGELTAATAYLGISADALRSSLESGKTLAQIADATTGKSASGLIDALVTAEQTELASAVKAGNLTQAQADQISTGLKAHVTDEVNGTFRGHEHDPGGPPPGAPPAPSSGYRTGGVHI